MRARRLWFSLIAIVVGAIALFTYEVGRGNTPALGLDLQGGVSVVLEPTEPVEHDELVTVADFVREAVDSLGIAEPDVRVEGDTIAVDLPGVRDQDDALELVNVTGAVSLHTVVQCGLPLMDPTESEGTTTTTLPPLAPLPPDDGAGTDDLDLEGLDELEGLDDGGADQSDEPGAGPQGIARTGAASATPTETTTAPATTSPTGASEPADADAATPAGGDEPAPGDPRSHYPHELDDGTVLMLDRDDSVCQVNPAGAEGTVFSRGGARADFLDLQGWGVVADLSGQYRDQWNALAAECFGGGTSCPTGQLAIVLDSVVQSAPRVQEPYFDEVVTITGDFGQEEARDLARILNRGAYPFDIAPTTVEAVDAQLGSESLNATIAAGLVGIALVLLYMVAYYRSLGMVIAAGLVLSGVLMYGVIAFLSAQQNLALTLAGCAGIIVSIGITVDSYIVYFERLKDDLRHGRTLRNAATRGFSGAWRTVVNGNIAGLIAAAVLFWLSAGSVRGFALFLGLSNLIDLLVTFTFTRPAVLLLSRTKRFGSGGALGLSPKPAASTGATS